MIIPKSIIQTFRKFANAFFARPRRRIGADIAMHATTDGCILQMSAAGQTITYRVTCKGFDKPLAQSIVISSDVLEQLAQSSGDIEIGPAGSTEHGNRLKVSWQIGPVARYVDIDLQTPSDVLPKDVLLTKIDDDFLPCLAHATEVADEESKRYSLGCIQLDGCKGTMVATDGNHLVYFDGFDFPWKSQLIHIRKSRLFFLKDFVNLRGVSVGSENSSFIIASGPWRFTLPIETDVRFPKVDQVIPDKRRSTNQVQLDSRDRDALSTCLSQLPGNSEDYKPVILDLNGHVAVVGKSHRGTSCLELDRSLHIGPDFRAGVPRENLAFVAKLGADRLFLYGKDQPIHACGPRMQYVWMPLINVDLKFEKSNTQWIRTSSVGVRSKGRRAC
jgi:hypothetical protein